MNPVYLIIRNDDFCALSDADKERAILNIFEKHQVPQVVGVIPFVAGDPHDYRKQDLHPLESNPRLIAMIKEYQAKGLLEVALHGYSHQTTMAHPNRLHTIHGERFMQGIDRKWLPALPVKGSFSEFNGLPIHEIKSRIARGRQYLEEILNLKVETFIFPWNSFTPGCLRVLKELGFKQVLCEHFNDYGVRELMVIGDIQTVFFNFDEIVPLIQRTTGPALVQATYHSWMYDDHDMAVLDRALESIRLKVIFRTCQDLPNNVRRAVRLRSWASAWSARANPYLGHKIQLAPECQLHGLAYLGEIIKAGITILIFEILGRRSAVHKADRKARCGAGHVSFR